MPASWEFRYKGRTRSSFVESKVDENAPCGYGVFRLFNEDYYCDRYEQSKQLIKLPLYPSFVLFFLHPFFRLGGPQYLFINL